MRGKILTLTATTVTYQPMGCTLCGKENAPIDLNRASFERWQAGDYIQVAFPQLTAATREIIMTGTHDACFNTLFPPDEDEDD